MTTDDIPNDVRKVAAALAKQDRCTPDYAIEVLPGFRVPQWLLYVSEAKRLIFERAAVVEAGGK